jgi:hypothetical protein
MFAVTARQRLRSRRGNVCGHGAATFVETLHATSLQMVATIRRIISNRSDTRLHYAPTPRCIRNNAVWRIQ